MKILPLIFTLPLLFQGMAYASDGQPKPGDSNCYYYKLIKGAGDDGKSERNMVFVHTNCLTQTGKDHISGKLVDGAPDLTPKEPTYVGLRIDLRKSVITNYGQKDITRFNRFIANEKDPIASSISTLSQLMPKSNGFTITRELVMPSTNGEMKTTIMPSSNGATITAHFSKLNKPWQDYTAEERQQYLDLLEKAYGGKNSNNRRTKTLATH